LELAAIHNKKTMRTMSDWELLQDYVKTRSEAAFAELVRRHIDWIFSVAVRRVGDPQLAGCSAIGVCLAGAQSREFALRHCPGWLALPLDVFCGQMLPAR
jgi:hypothetical protein